MLRVGPSIGFDSGDRLFASVSEPGNLGAAVPVITGRLVVGAGAP